MKKIGIIIFVTLLFATLLTVINTGQATMPRGLPYSCDIEPVSYTKNTGQLTVELTITQVFELDVLTGCDSVSVSLSVVDGLVYAGQLSWKVYVDSLTPYTTRLEVTTPANDTSGLIVVLECNKYRMNYDRYFITISDTVKAVWSDPRYHYNLPDPMTEEERAKLRQKEHERAYQEWLEKQKIPSVGTGTLHPIMNPEDSDIVKTLTDKGKRLWGKMRYLERTPLTDEERQWFVIGGRWYLRERGEYKFRYVPGRTNEEIRVDAQRYWDSLDANPPNNPYDVILDLRDPKDYDYAHSLVDSLVPTEEKGFYRTVVNRATLTKLVNSGINQRRANRPPMIPNDTTSKQL